MKKAYFRVKRGNKVLAKRGSYFIILIILIAVIIFALWQIFFPKNLSSQDQKIFIVEKGQGAKEISSNLEKEGLIKYGSLFRIYVLFTGKSLNLQAGEYSFSSAMSISEIANKIASGDIRKITITIPEGFSISDIENEITKQGLGENVELFSKQTKSYKDDFDFLISVPDNASLEGFLFPDTYQFSYRATTDEIIRKFLQNFDKKLDSDLRKEISNQKKTILKIITVASLIEKEVRTKEDKNIVSGIIWKRLELGMYLNIDATLTYITGKNSTKISTEETKIDSPYNTYKYRGLPPGPICNPGIESIKTALYPKNSEYLYYLSTPEGKTIFSKTLEEHNINKEKYLR